MENTNFIFKFDDSQVDLTRIIDVNELQEYELILYPMTKMNVEAYINENRIPLQQLWNKEEPGYHFQGKHKFNDIGLSILKLVVNGKPITQKIRVKPVKITQKDYELILEDIKREAYNLVFTVFSHSLEEIRLMQRFQPRSYLEFFSFFEKNFKAFRDIFRRIEKDPNRGLIQEMKVAEIYEIDILMISLSLKSQIKLFFLSKRSFKGSFQ